MKLSKFLCTSITDSILFNLYYYNLFYIVKNKFIFNKTLNKNYLKTIRRSLLNFFFSLF